MTPEDRKQLWIIGKGFLLFTALCVWQWIFATNKDISEVRDSAPVAVLYYLMQRKSP